ncbi:uncharacterized protein V1513DRAFT_468331, partial [Lipomyces chichibuensis]|uniref:uncharacterized protein n=1 Tax=Lipomyces chichibuensis TaxID=1546026 RepID=UPI0033439D15
ALGQPYTWIIVDQPIASRCIQASLYLISASFVMSWGPIEWLYPPEIIPLHVRCKAVSLSTSTHYGINLGWALSMLSVWRKILWGVFFISAAIYLAACIHVWLQIPETKQRTLEEMDEIFEHGDQIWRSFTGATYSGRLDLLAKDFEQGKSIFIPAGDTISEDPPTNLIRRHSGLGKSSPTCKPLPATYLRPSLLVSLAPPVLWVRSFRCGRVRIIFRPGNYWILAYR